MNQFKEGSLLQLTLENDFTSQYGIFNQGWRAAYILKKLPLASRFEGLTLLFQKLLHNMKYFAYGSNMFTYRLEKRIGKVKKIGIGKLIQHKLIVNKVSKDGSSKATVLFTNNEEDSVYGVVFEINENQKPNLDKIEGLGAGYAEKVVGIELIENSNENIQANTYEATDTQGGNLPYDWYMNFIIRGAVENGLPETYIDFLKSISYKADENVVRKDSQEWIFKESQMIRKYLSPTFDLYNELNKSKQCVISLPGHAFNDRNILIEKAETGFSFQTDSKIIKGLQTHKEFEVRNHLITFNETANKWFVEGKHFLINHIDYDDENLLKILRGQLNSLGSLRQDEFSEKYLRVIIPIKKSLKIDRDYQCYPFIADHKLNRGLIEVKIKDKVIHYYSLKLSGRDYLVIDCCNPTSLREFQFICNSILLTYALLSNDYNTGEAYYFSFSNSDFETSNGILFHSLSEPIFELFGVYTTNPYLEQTILHKEQNEDKEEEDRKINELRKELNWFPSDVFSKMCEFAFTNEKILRTLILLINKNSILELKIPNQYVALETITSALIKGNAELKPIEDDALAKQLTENLKSVVREFAKANGIENELENRLIPITKRLDSLNSPPNADKLSKLFDVLGYTLNSDERKIIKMRDKFLHGSTISVGLEEDDFKEHFYISLRLHFLIAVLILRTAGFNGRIINYPKLYEYITDKYIDEEVFKKI